MKHPSEHDLALRAGGEAGRLRGLLLDRHLRNCEDCQEKVSEFTALREQIAEVELPEPEWNALAAEMKANIRVGLEAGACVRPAVLITGNWMPRLGVAFATLLLVIGASFVMTNSAPRQVKAPQPAAPVLQASGSGIELRNGASSFTLSDRQDAPADQTVSAQGVMEARYVNGEAGSVTITNVYLQQ